MTNRIPKTEWKQFFENLSRRKNGWETTVEILSHENGAQILADRLPLAGITAEDLFGEIRIEIMIGDPVIYQTHTISQPKTVYFHRQEMNLSNLIEIEDETDVKTLIQIVQPFPVRVAYVDQRFDLRTF